MAFNFDLKSLLGPLTSFLGQEGSGVNMGALLAQAGVSNPDQLARIMAAQGITPPKKGQPTQPTNIVGDLVAKAQGAVAPTQVIESSAIPGGGSFNEKLRSMFPELFGPPQGQAPTPPLGSLINSPLRGNLFPANSYLIRFSLRLSLSSQIFQF